MPFTEVRPKKTFVQVAEQISDAIRRGEYAPGDRLPPERELAQTFRISRQAMREALAALQLAGIVETRAGVGSVVSAPPGAESSERLWSLADEESPAEVMEARRIVEPRIAALAAARIADEDRHELRRLLVRMRAASEESPAGEGLRFGTLDLEFHRLVARASGNAVLAGFVEAAASYADQRLWRSLREASYRREPALARRFLHQHEALVAAIEAGDGETAARVMESHLDASLDLWFGEPEQGQ